MDSSNNFSSNPILPAATGASSSNREVANERNTVKAPVAPAMVSVVSSAPHRPLLRPTRFHCIHPNCKKSFKDEVELKAHLIAYNPGMAAENQFLRDTCVALVSAIEKVRAVYPQTVPLVRKIVLFSPSYVIIILCFLIIFN